MKRDKISEDKIKEVLSKLVGSPAFMVSIALVMLNLMQSPENRQPWRDTLPQVGGKTNSAWRGKGSFGSAPFGSQMTRK